MNTTLLHGALFAALAALLAPAASLQTAPNQELVFPQASPAAKLEQRIGLTDVSVAYGRPGLKGRKIFGGLQPYGEVWRTGANAATRIVFSQAVKFAGEEVPAGTYALFTIPDATEWTVIVNQDAEQWGAYAYDAKKDVARVKVKPVALAEPLETLAIGFSDVRDDSATLEIAWEKTRVAIKIETGIVEALAPRIERAMSGEGKKPYFQAAMFYYEHGIELKQALAWIDEAIREKPDQMWMIYRKGLILEKLGDKQAAQAAATQSMELAAKAGGAIGAEYTRLNEMLIARCR